MDYLKQLTTKERLLFFWRGEVEARLKEWQECQRNEDKAGAEQAKRHYINAKLTLDSIEGSYPE